MIVQVDISVKKVLNCYYDRAKRIGVVVGRVSPEEGVVLHFIPTPDLEEVLDTKSCLPHEEWWIEDHAHQVWDMLPGGLSVVGLCLASPSFEHAAATSLSKLARRLSKSKTSVFLVLHFSTVTAKFTCQCQSIEHHVGGSLLPVEIVVDELHHLWCCLESRVTVQLKELTPLGKPAEMQRKLMAGLSCWSLGSVVVGNKYGNCEGCLADHVEGHSAQCVVYPKHQPLLYGRSDIMEQQSAVTLCGNISVIAYAPFAASLVEASKAVTDDVVKTVVVRWKKLCDDLKLEKRLVTGSWQLPRRVELAVEGCMFQVCAYMFADEKEEDVCERIAELLGVGLDTVSVMHTERSYVEVKQPAKGSSSKVCTLLAVVLLLVLCITIIYYLMA